MTRLREHLSAWAVVACLAAVMLGIWGLQAPQDQGQSATALACNEPSVPAASVTLPRRSGWMPDAVLAGLPEEGQVQTAYELSEARNLERYRAARSQSGAVAYGSNTNLNPTRMC